MSYATKSLILTAEQRIPPVAWMRFQIGSESTIGATEAPAEALRLPRKLQPKFPSLVDHLTRGAAKKVGDFFRRLAMLDTPAKVA
jgi:hypothetical protein